MAVTVRSASIRLQSDASSFEHDETLIGAGFGFEVQVRRYLSARMDIGFALDESARLGVDKGDAELHFSVTGLY